MSQNMDMSGADVDAGAMNAENGAQAGGAMGSTESGGAPASTSPADWRATLPEAWRSHFQSVASEEEALKIFQRGQAYVPPTKADDIKLDYPKDFGVDSALEQHFREMCVKEGITGKQAQALLDWQIKANQTAQEKLISEGLETLRQNWGANFDTHRQTALKAFMALDKRLGGELAKSFSGQRMANDPVMIRAFSELGKLMSEDTLAGGMGGTSDRETPEQTYESMFKKD